MKFDDAPGYPYAAIRLRLHDLLYATAVLALLFADLTPALRSGNWREWYSAALVLTVFGMLFLPVILICLVVHFAPTTLEEERATVRMVFKSTLLLFLLATTLVIHGY